MELLFIANSILLGVGLAMDAFSVSMANGLLEPKMSGRRQAAIASVYGIFQAVMPMTGWVCVHTIVELFGVFEKIVPWISLILLVYIGGKMLLEGIRRKEVEVSKSKLTFKVLLFQGVATSIDALSVGFTIAEYSILRALSASLIIATVTFFICVGGLQIGKTIGTKWASKATILGGLILIGIGIEIFITGWYF